MQPLVLGVLDFTTALNKVDPLHRRPPSVDSPAMAEIHDQNDYEKRSGWKRPFDDTHVLGALTLRAATDYVRLFAETLNAAQPPLYGHLALARGALESSVVCRWVSEPGLARDERVKRGLSEYLYAAV